MDKDHAYRLTRLIFVGREGELQRWGDVLDEAAKGRPRLVLLAGETGIGRTALATEFLAMAEKQGWWHCRVQCCDPSLEPYAPWGEVFEALGRPHDETQEALRNSKGHLAVCQDLTTLLCDASRRAPVLVLVEDLHKAESSAVQVLEYAVAHAGNSRLILLATYRDDEPEADHAARRVGGGLPTHSFDRVVLHGLREDDVRAILQQVTAQTVPRRLVRYFHAKSGGNPLLLVQLLWERLEDGVLARDGVHWPSPVELENVEAADSIGAILDRRIERRPEDVRLVLQHAALFPWGFDIDCLGRLGFLPPERLAAGLDAARGTGLLTALGAPGWYRFEHGAFQDVLRERLGIVRRARCHRMIAEWLVARPNASDAEVLEAAYHFRQAGIAGGDAERAVRFALRAAEIEEGRRNWDAAAEQYEHALALAPRVTWSDGAWRFDVLLRRVEALGRVARLAEQRDATREARQVVRCHGQERITHLALAYGGNVRGFGRLRYEEFAVGLYEEALSVADMKPAHRALLQARLAEELMMGGGDVQGRARRLMEEALATARACSDPRVEAAVLRSLHWGPRQEDGARVRLARAEEIVALAANGRDDELALEGEIARALALLELGDAVRARAALGRVKDAADARPYYRWVFACIEGCLAFVEGRLGDVEGLAQKAYQLGVDAEVESVGVIRTAQLGHLLWLRGRLDELDVGLRELPGTEPQAYPAIEAIVRCALAATWAEDGRHADALAYVEEYARDDFRAVPLNALWLPSMVFLGLACHAGKAVEPARRLYELLLPFAGNHVLLPLMVSYGATDYFLGLLAETLGDRAAAERHYEAALDANRRAGTAQWTARTQLALARVLLESGDAAEGAAAELLQGAQQTAEALGMRKVAEMVQRVLAVAGPVPVRRGTFVFRPNGRGFFVQSAECPLGKVLAKSLSVEDLYRAVSSPGIAIEISDPAPKGNGRPPSEGNPMREGQRRGAAAARKRFSRGIKRIEWSGGPCHDMATHLRETVERKGRSWTYKPPATDAPVWILV